MKWFLCLLVVATGSVEAQNVQWDRRGINQYCKDVSRRLGWVQTGEGYSHDVPAVSPSVMFDSSQRLSLEEARRLIVDECTYLLELANRTQPRKVTQITGPFTIRNLDYSVFFRDSHSRMRYEPPFVAGVFLIKGQVVYESYCNSTKRFSRIHKEPYEEAVRIVKAEQAVECR